MKQFVWQQKHKAFQWGVDPTIEILNNCKGYIHNEHIFPVYDKDNHHMAMTVTTCFGEWAELKPGMWIVLIQFGTDEA